MALLIKDFNFTRASGGLAMGVKLSLERLLKRCRLYCSGE